MHEEKKLRFRLRPAPCDHGRDKRSPDESCRHAAPRAARRLPVPALPSIPHRPFWEDVEYHGLKAMPVGQYLFRIRHPRLDLKIDMRRLPVHWQRPVFVPCSPGQLCEDPVRYWATKFMMDREDWEALLGLGPPAIPPGTTMDDLLSPGLRLELHYVTRHGVKAHRATRHFAGPGRHGRLKWRLEWNGEDASGPEGPSRVLQIWEEWGCHIWDGAGVCATLDDIFGDFLDTAVLESFENRFATWAGAISSWPRDLVFEHPFDPAIDTLAGFDWPAFHRAGIRLAMELKALVGHRGVVIYTGGPHDRSWPLQLDLLIDFPPP